MVSLQPISSELNTQTHHLFQLNQQIGQFIHQYQCRIQGDLHNSCIFTFVVPEKTISHKIMIETMLSNCCLVMMVGINLSQQWQELIKSGLDKLRFRINCQNAQKGNIFTFEFHQNSKTLLTKTCWSQDQLQPEISKLLSSNVQQLKKLTLSLLEIKNKNPSENIQFLLSMLQLDRKVRSKASTSINIHQQTEEMFSTKQFKIVDEPDFGRFQNMVLGYESQLKRKLSRHQRILRQVKQVKIEYDDTWKNNKGENGIVKKCNAIYKINPDSSINSQTNEEINKAQQKNKNRNGINQNNTSNCQEINEKSKKIQEKTVVGCLVKKIPTHEESARSFNIQRKILTFLRGQRCYAINNFYCLQNQNIQNIMYFYSDFHDRTISYRFDKIKNYLKVFLSLLEGLVFLGWNAISHRDFKPDNVLLSKDYTSKIIDFGSACHNKHYKIDTTKQRELRVLPEQLRTNAYYNLRYSDLPQNLKELYFRMEYETHPFFDMYSFGSIVEEVFQTEEARTQFGQLQWEYFRSVISLCKQKNPDDRPDPRKLYVLFGEILRMDKN